MEVPEDEGAMLYKSMIGVNQTPSGKRRSYIGVNQTPSGRWEAQIRLASKVLRLGTFGTAEAAAAAYDEAASRFRGSTAELNFPKSEPPLPTGEEDGSNSSSGNHKKRRNYRGVWQRASGKWYAQFHDSKIGVHKYSPHVSHSTGNKTKRKYIGIRRKLSGNRDPNKRTIVHLGTLKAAKDAAMVYDEAALKIQGNETTLNFSKRLSLEADPQGVSHSTGNKTIKKRYRGVRQESTGKWIARIYVSKIVGDVCLGRFDTAEEAARAYDEAALKKQYRNGQKPILNFPDREADSRISDAHSVQLLASGEDMPSKRKCGSKSSPGSIPTLPSQEEDQNDQSSPEHQNVGNPVSLDEGNIVKPDSSAQPKEEAFHQNPCQDCVFSSSWSDLSLLDSYVERDRAMSSMMAALNETIHQTFSDIAPCRPIFPHPDDVEGECSEAERNAGDSSIPRTVSPVLEDPMDQRLQEASLSESRSFQDAGSVDRDGSKMMVKVHYKDDIIIKFELSPSSTKLELEEKVAIRLKLSVGSFDVRYEDKDKDWILVACDEDLRTCMSTASSFGSDALKMRIVVSN